MFHLNLTLLLRVCRKRCEGYKKGGSPFHRILRPLVLLVCFYGFTCKTLAPQNTNLVCTEHCQWTMLYREISTVTSLHYCYVGNGFFALSIASLQELGDGCMCARTQSILFWFLHHNVLKELLGGPIT